MIYVTKSSMPSFEEYCDEIKELWDTCILTNNGVKHKQLEQMLKEYTGIQNITLFTNGHLALEAIIEALNITGEVITTPFTFISTTNALVRKGLTPVFCDINYNDLTIDTLKIESLITEKTSAILPVHVYGNICNIEEIQRIAKKYNLKVIYDAAHAFGVRYNGISSANFGDASMFSFHSTKVFHTIEGGAVCYNDGTLKERLNQIKNFGLIGAEQAEYIGGNAKMNEFQAAMGICNLRHLEGEIAKRKEIYNILFSGLCHIKGINIPCQKENVVSNYAYFPVLIDSKEFGKTRDQVFEALLENGFCARKYFYPLISEFNCYKGKYISDVPVALKASNQVLCLPIYAELLPEQAEKIIEIIENI